MATKALLDAYKVVIQALAEKHVVSTSEVRDILSGVSNQELVNLDWKDLDTVILEGLVKKGYNQRPEADEEYDNREVYWPEEYPDD